ncbi:hypothetical protein AGMMS49944_30220 [Spirochaetia bacterium]|nr:hypothetical protein AGMMS49944_30220 [Spirochaetia bacterium]
MPIQKTIENPASRRITVDVPGEIPVGPVILTFTPAPSPAKEPEPEARSSKEMFDEVARRLGYKDDLDYLEANSPTTLEEIEAEAERKFKTRKSIYEYYGCLKGEDIYGDGMEYQRMMRDEWAHRP